MVCKAVVDRALDGDMSRVAGYRARFWGRLPRRDLGDQHLGRGRPSAGDRGDRRAGQPVISNGLVTLSG